MKRILDVAVSLTALVLLAPAFAIIALAIKIDSPGTVWFRQERIGRGMRRFRVIKFRTMKERTGGDAGSLLTVEGDARITRVGGFLRKAKLDEFPQLLNVLFGDMSLVGPRPEVPEYVELFAKDYEIILGVRPGLTDPASFKYRNEAAILAAAPDPEREYVERILPDKIRLAKAYVADSCLSLDLTLIMKTVLEAVGMEAGPMARGILRHRRPMVITLQLALVILSYYLAWQLRFDGRVPARERGIIWTFLPWLLVLRAVFFARFRLYQGLWRYTSLSDGVSIATAVALSSVPFVIVVRLVYGEAAHPRSVFVIDAVLLIALMVAVRLGRRLYHELAAARPGVRVLVFGASDAGEFVIRELKKSEKYRVIGLVDDDPDKRGRRIHGVPVLGGRKDLPGILATHKCSEVLVALNRQDPVLMTDLLRLVEPFGVTLTVLPMRTQSLDRAVELRDVRNVRVEDLLSRPVLHVERRELARLIFGRRILITGAGGSIGSELARQIAPLEPLSLVLLDRHEDSLQAIAAELEHRRLPVNISAIIGDVADAGRLDQLMTRHEPEIVFHAAAYKQVALLERNPCEAATNNITGTRVLAEAAIAYGVERFIFISTAKAVNPTSVMGATRRLAELIIQELATESATLFTTVRLGNVLGGGDSVITPLLDQIRAGGPVTVADPEIRRFFMLIPEAAQLVLCAAAGAESGVTYVLDTGEQVKLVDLARNLIRLSGLVPDDDIKIEFTGLGESETLSEALVGPDEVALPAVNNILCVRGTGALAPSFMARTMRLQEEAAQGNSGAVLTMLSELSGIMAPRPSGLGAGLSGFAAAGAEEIARDRNCPGCGNGRVHRVRTTNVRDRVRKELTLRRQYECAECKWRGWLLPVEAACAPLPHESMPDLTRLDDTPPVPSDAGRKLSPRKLA